MRITKFALAGVLVASLGFVQVSAMQVTMGGFKSGAAGRYSVNPSADLVGMMGLYSDLAKTDNGWHGSFCIEKNEFFSKGSTYNAAISPTAKKGGLKITDSVGPLTRKAAIRFQRGVLICLCSLRLAS